MIRKMTKNINNRVYLFILLKIKKIKDRIIIRQYFKNAKNWPKAMSSGNKMGKSILVISNTNWHLRIQQELLISRIAEINKCSVYLIGSNLSKKYWELAGFEKKRFIPWEFYEKKWRSIAEKQAEDVLKKRKNFDELREYVFEGVMVGRHVLSSVGRSHFCALFNPFERTYFESIRKCMIITLTNYMAIKDIKKDYMFEQVLMNEPNYTGSGVSQAFLLDGGSYIQFCHPYEEGATIFKRYSLKNNNINPISLSEASWKIIQEEYDKDSIETDVETLIANKYSKKNVFSIRIGLDSEKLAPRDIREKLKIDNGKKTAVIFSHVLWDANMFWGEDLYKRGAEEWLIESVKLAIENIKVNWIIKVHPANIWKMKESGAKGEYNDVISIKRTLGELPPHIQFLLPEQKINPLSLFKAIDFGITIRGTVGMELPMFGVPCITAGTGRYSGRGFTIDPKNIYEYENIIKKLPDINSLTEKQIMSAKLFFWGIFRRRPWRSKLYKCNYHPFDVNRQFLQLQDWGNYGINDQALGEFLCNENIEDYLSPIKNI